MGSNHTCLALIKIDFSLKKDENYYLQVFVKECKYIEKKAIRHIHDDLILMILLKNRLKVNIKSR